MLRLIVGLAMATIFCAPAAALDRETIARLAGGDAEEQRLALDALVAKRDVAALPFLRDLLADHVRTADDGVFIVEDDHGLDALQRTPVALPAELEEVSTSNSVRLAIEESIAALELASPDPATRLESVKRLQSAELDEARLALIAEAESRERDSAVRDALRQIRALSELQSTHRTVRLAAAKALRASVSGRVREALKARLSVEEDGEIRVALTRSLRNIESSLAVGETLGIVFSGVSLASILLLAALGLAVTYGLMGVINMAHGEMMMIGAYATYVVQNLFRAHLPDHFQYYLAAAAPVAFVVAALVGVVIERLVIRFLYGRALETLLATWGVSLILMQTVRTIFGAQNVQVENPAWMSGRLFVTDNLELPYNRVVIILFSLAVLLLVSFLLARTRLGLFVRAVTQNRTMAKCVGVDSSRIDTIAFALGSGIAGLAGVALSQVGNVGPDLGQHYIVDSFMVVVLGGVGQLAGAVYAALGLGVAGKIFENLVGAVLAEIGLLVFLIVFIQKRPQGLFALGGRQAD
ncbi:MULTISPECIES: urea ABC transporter permease subunit UrtB [Methylosinus]|uniref:Urea ABC transporter permease subunit UrtB n=1 Tax=Methylosinus trichosporium (strain ATCC 35070 / NCIMB 11131 / UNIQEM 75 / OB3b) TaxID=595536 RepID=A0A2D2D6E3_METT3|nr:MULTISPECIES: urea ABC transporter permease subunit UrtB [Methylosinus]ATQ70556.1 urea ABC transporter permease subunit UrtB [Methylosinus trichosporium OB3b]OBS50654.1 urea ABC transporter permease subunit UrtB [Methylosinus sp. 3S-1]